MAGPAWHAVQALPGGRNQSGLCLVECETFRQDGVVTSFDERDETGRQCRGLFARDVGRVTGPPQQTLHFTRPVFFLDFDQCLNFAQVVRVAQRVQNAFQGLVRLPMVVYDDPQDIFQQAASFGRGPVKCQPDRR